MMESAAKAESDESSKQTFPLSGSISNAVCERKNSKILFLWSPSPVPCCREFCGSLDCGFDINVRVKKIRVKGAVLSAAPDDSSQICMQVRLLS
mmetsp:Transcript_59400/g.124119  ORF Transcript_59400/g.124119 Transcript_59400/m.124119 type:complete len:94 (+) Transcript_59400:999-1280(+)